MRSSRSPSKIDSADNGRLRRSGSFSRGRSVDQQSMDSPRSVRSVSISRVASVHSQAGGNMSRASSTWSRPEEALADAVAMKQRRQEVAKNAKQRREAKEMESCSFSPKLDSRSMKLVNRGAGHDKPALHTPRVRPEKSRESVSPVVSPRINSVSRAIAERLDRAGSVESRLMSAGAGWVEKHRQEKDAAQRREETEFSHTPKIDSKSREIASHSGTSAYERLTRTYSQHREQSVEKLKKEADDRLADSVAKLHFMCEASKKILKNPMSSRTSSTAGDHSVSSTVSTPHRNISWTPLLQGRAITPLGSPPAMMGGHASSGKSTLSHLKNGGGYTLSEFSPNVPDTISPVCSAANSPGMGLDLARPASRGSSPPQRAGHSRSFDRGSPMERSLHNGAIEKQVAEGLKHADETALKSEVHRLSARCGMLDQELERIRARMFELEHERDSARRSAEVMRRDLDSITEKGHAVVRLNQSLMAQVKSLREGNHQQNSNGSGVNEHQRHAGFEGHASGHNGFGNGAVVGDMMTPNGSGGYGTVPASQDRMPLSAESGPHVSAMPLSAAAKAAMSLSPRAGRRRIRPASDSDDSYSTLDDD